MKYVISIFLLVLPVFIYGQIMRTGGKVVRSGGVGIVRVTPYDGEDPGPTPNPWDDSTTVYWHEDFEDWTIESDMTEATVRSHWGDDADVQSDASNTLRHAAIESFDGSKVFVSEFDEDSCCAGSTGAHIELPLGSEYEEVYLSFNLWLPSDFELPEGTKMPGMRTNASNPFARIMLKNYTTPDPDILTAIQYYMQTYDADDTEPNYVVRTREDSVPKGYWHNLTYRFYAGTTDTDNGRFEVFLDTVFINYTEVAKYKSSNDNTNDWGIFSFETFMGGSDPSYNSPKDQEHYIDDIVIWMYDEGVSVTTGANSSDTDRELGLPTECNWPR